jgi:general stress protein 26
MPDQPQGAATVAELAKDIRIGMLTTVDASGEMISRPMALQETEFDGDFWFFAERGSRKIAHIAANPSVNVTLASGQTWISIYGQARMVDDAAKAKVTGHPYDGGENEQVRL